MILPASLEHRLMVLEAKDAIRELVSRYAWYAALADADAMVKLFTGDGILEQPDGIKAGRAAIQAYFEQLPRGYIAPVVSNFLIAFDDADNASSTCKMITLFAGSGPGVTGWYEDRYRRIGNEWLFARRLWTSQKPS